MKPAAFKYFAPETVEEALEHLAQYGYDAKVLAGGQSLVPTMNFRMAQPAVLIDLNNISELFYIKSYESGGVLVGAMTRQRAVEKDGLISRQAALVHETIPHISHPQIRNRGTFGGSIAHADPSAELPAVMLALNARFHLRNKSGERWVAAGDFFTGMFATILEPDEILSEIHIPPMPPGSGWAFREVARRHGDFALVGVAAVVTLDHTGKCHKARITLMSVGDGPVVAEEAERLLIGETGREEAIDAAAETASAKDIDPPSDIHASAEFRRHLARVLTAQALSQAFGRARNSFQK